MVKKIITIILLIYSSNQICLSQSEACDSAISWYVLKEPVFVDPDDNFVKDPSVLRTEHEYYMFYTGAAPGFQGADPTATWQIEYATSPDGLNWTKQGIAFKADSNTWECGRVQAPGRPVWYKGKYYMFYTGGPRKPKNLIYTGLATSKDLVHWTKKPDTIPQNVERANDIFIYPENSLFYMFYTTYTDDGEPVFFRTSRDLENWSEPVRTSADGEGVVVWKENGSYYLIACSGYSGKGELYRLFKSQDLIHFSFCGPLLKSLPEWSSDAYGHGDVIKNGDEYWLYFQGTDNGGTSFVIGLAKSIIQ